jgi:hypothetical protein
MACKLIKFGEGAKEEAKSLNRPSPPEPSVLGVLASALATVAILAKTPDAAVRDSTRSRLASRLTARTAADCVRWVDSVAPP